MKFLLDGRLLVWLGITATLCAFLAFAYTLGAGGQQASAQATVSSQETVAELVALAPRGLGGSNESVNAWAERVENLAAGEARRRAAALGFQDNITKSLDQVAQSAGAVSEAPARNTAVRAVLTSISDLMQVAGGKKAPTLGYLPEGSQTSGPAEAGEPSSPPKVPFEKFPKPKPKPKGAGQ